MRINHAVKSLSFALLSSTILGSAFLGGCLAKKEGALDEGQTENVAAVNLQALELTPDPAITYGQLGNGMRYAIMANDTPSKTAAMRLRFATGSLNEHDDIQGLAHFLEHMAFNGSENIPEGEMIKRLERYGLAFGADTNAYTSFDETVYTLDLPEITEEMFDVTLDIMRETASNLTLNQSAIEAERGVVASEKRGRDSASYRAQLASLDFYLSQSRIPSRLPIGEDDDIASMDKADFERFYHGYYRPENAFMVIVGDIDPAFVEEKINAHFSDWTAQGEPLEQKTAGTAHVSGPKTGYFTDPDIRTSISLSVMRPYEDEEDTALIRRNNLVEGLGNRILNRRLSTLAQNENAVFISAGASSSDLYEATELSSLSISSQTGRWDEALAVGEQELRRALQYGFTQTELDEQLANTRKSLEIGVQTAETRRTGSLASGLINSFSNETIFTTPQSALERYDAYEDDITTDEVWTRFKALWEGIDSPILYLSTPELIEDPDTQIMAALETSRAVPVSAPKQTVTAEFAYQNFGTPGDIVSRELIEPENIHTLIFDNNVRLNLKQTDFDKDSIQINVQFGGGFLSLPEANPNVQQLAGYVVNIGGLEAHSADELRRILAGKAVGSDFGVSTKHFSLTGSTVPQDLSDQLNLMAASLTAPGYRPEAKARYDKQIESWYPTLDSTPSGVASRDIGKYIYSGDPRFGYPDEDGFLSVTTQDVKDWLKPHFENGPIEISIIGDFDLNTVIDEVARTFGALPKRPLSLTQNYDKARILTFPDAVPAPIRLEHEGEANRSLLRVYWPAPDGSDTLRARRIGVLEEIFGNRLTQVIREEEGAAYSPSAFSYLPETYEGYGYLGVSLDLDPKDIDRIFKVVDAIAADFKAGRFSDDEFKRAITPVLENIETSLERNGYWMNVISEAQSRPDYIEDHRDRLETYQSMTLSDLKPLAAQIFDSTTAMRFEILPKG